MCVCVCVCVCVANTHARVVARRSWRHSRADRRADTRPWRHMVVATHGGGDTQSWRHTTDEKGKASDGERWVEGAVAVARWRLQQIKGELRTCPDRNSRDRETATLQTGTNVARTSAGVTAPHWHWHGVGAPGGSLGPGGAGWGAALLGMPHHPSASAPALAPTPAAGHYLCHRGNSGKNKWYLMAMSRKRPNPSMQIIKKKPSNEDHLRIK